MFFLIMSYTTSRFFLLKIPFSDKDIRVKRIKKQKNTALSNTIMLCVQIGYIVISFPKHTKKALMCSPKAVTTLAFMQRDCEDDRAVTKALIVGGGGGGCIFIYSRSARRIST